MPRQQQVVPAAVLLTPHEVVQKSEASGCMAAESIGGWAVAEVVGDGGYVARKLVQEGVQVRWDDLQVCKRPYTVCKRLCDAGNDL